MARDAWLWLNQELSDVTLKLVKETQASGKRKSCLDDQEQAAPLCVLPGHKVVLAGESNVFKARLLRWGAEQEPAGPAGDTVGAAVKTAPPSLEVIITESLLDASKLALQYAYTLELPSLGVMQLLQVARVADAWDMPRCLAACLAQLATAELSVESVNTLLSQPLPDGVMQHAAFSAVREACRLWLVKQFGRILDVANQATLLADFITLNKEALLLWAVQDNLVVDSENTVVWLLDKWWQHRYPTHPLTADSEEHSQQHSRASRKAKLDLAKRLREVVRVQHLTTGFLMSIHKVPWFQGGSEDALSLLRAARALKQLPLAGSALSNDDWDGGGTAVPKAWLQGARHMMNPQYPVLEWTVTKQQLQQLHNRVVESGSQYPWLQSTPVCRAGMELGLCLMCDPQASTLKLGLQYRSGCPPAIRLAAELRVGRDGQHKQQQRLDRPPYLSHGWAMNEPIPAGQPAPGQPSANALVSAELWAQEGQDQVLHLSAAITLID